MSGHRHEEKEAAPQAEAKVKTGRPEADSDWRTRMRFVKLEHQDGETMYVSEDGGIVIKGEPRKVPNGTIIYVQGCMHAVKHAPEHVVSEFERHSG